MSNITKQLAVTVILAVVVFILLPVLGLQLETNIALAAGVLIGGFIVSFIPSSSDSDSTDSPQVYKGASKTLYVGNLPYRANEAAVRELFSKHAKVVSVRLMRDRNTGKRKGFGFVEIAEKDAENAISALNDAEFQQRTLKVREAKDRPAPQQQDDAKLATE
ncbi:RNA-binding protein [Saccharobesus litoralis]|uniref:RNA-binding protein n=1 Tax=Saccharobesus litoralis TaxID=2172099 RepID=A0A2S0VXS9_9ALTE|nr:RNA-binding protein [Saccharobesus litoralis]AWB68998.1 RNA-binding protein [Saccharobesus litoralis]